MQFEEFGFIVAMVAMLVVFGVIPLAVGFLVQSAVRHQLPEWGVAIVAVLLAVPGWAWGKGFRIALADRPVLGFIATAVFLFAFLRIGVALSYRWRERREASEPHHGTEA